MATRLRPLESETLEVVETTEKDALVSSEPSILTALGYEVILI